MDKDKIARFIRKQKVSFVCSVDDEEGQILLRPEDGEF